MGDSNRPRVSNVRGKNYGEQIIYLLMESNRKQEQILRELKQIRERGAK